MRYAGIIKNDISAGEGVCVSFFTQGCPNHCEGCHNPETWNFNGGKEFTTKTLEDTLSAINANGIQRNFCVMGGEPLCPENLPLTLLLCRAVKNKFPNIKIYIWTGYIFENLLKEENSTLKEILSLSNFLIDGPYLKDKRDITLPMRGSSNQRIISLEK